MDDFFILGQIPGTGLVMSFWMWVEIAALTFLLLAWAGYRRHIAVRSYVPPTISSEPGNLQTATAH